MSSLLIIQDSPLNENPSVCSSCGGECCKRMPGEYSPRQFLDSTTGKLSKRALLNKLDTGLAVFDWWEGDVKKPGGRMSRIYYLRPPVPSGEGRKIHGAWYGPCSLHTPQGCPLSFVDRPYGCQQLIPNPLKPGDCRQVSDDRYSHMGSKEIAAWLWRPYQRVMRAMARRLWSEL